MAHVVIAKRRAHRRSRGGDTITRRKPALPSRIAAMLSMGSTCPFAHLLRCSQRQTSTTR
eukprot:scaffold168768_cov37-Tisochrysis_lutea.AAC.3